MGVALEPGAYRAILLTSGVGMLLLAACAARQSKPPGPGAVFVVDEPVAPAPAAEEGGETREEERAWSASLDPVALSVEVSPRLLYVPWETPEGKPAETMRVERETPSAAGADTADGSELAWEVRRWLIAGKGKEGGEGEGRPKTQETFVLTADGSVALAESVNHGESVVVVFEPPMVVAPAGLTPGESFTQQVRMSVYPIGSDRQTPQTAGDATQEVTYVGDERIRTPAPGPEDGAWPSRHLRSVLTVQLGPAQVRNELHQWLVDGVGIVSEQRHEVTSFAGVPVRNNLERWALLSAAGGEATKGGEVRTPGTPAPARSPLEEPAGASSPPSSPPAGGTPPRGSGPSPSPAPQRSESAGG